MITAAHQAGLRLGRAGDFTSEPGRMVSARVAGRLVQIGGPAISWPQPRDGHPSAATVTSLEEAGQTAVVVLLDVSGLACWASPTSFAPRPLPPSPPSPP